MKNQDGAKNVAGDAAEQERTDQKRAEEARRISEERYRTLAESTTDVVYIVDSEGTLLYANQRAAAYMGLIPPALVGKRQQDLFPPNLAKRHVERLRRVFETGEVGEDDELLHFGSEDVWLNVRSIPLRDEHGQITSVMGVCRNITDRKRVEEALQKAHDELEQRVRERTAELTKANEELAIFRRFAEASEEGFGMSDFDGRIAYVNPTLCRLFGEEKPEDVIGKNVSTYYHENYAQRRKNELIPTLLREGHWHVEQTLLPRRGKPIATLQSTFLIRDESGNPFRIAVVISDITEHKRAEEALRQAHDELRAIYDRMVDGVLIGDAENANLIRVNSAYCRMLGYSEEEAYALSPERVHPPEVLSKVWEHLEAVKKGLVARIDNLPFLRKDGGVVYADVVSSPIRYNERPCWICFFHDVTERKRAEEALKKERRTLKHLLQSSDHERRTIAYEIHDELAQQLAGALMMLQTYDHLKGTKPKEAAKSFEAGMTMLQRSHFEARRLIAGVRPPVLDESGVVEAIAHLVHEQGRSTKQKIDFHSRVDFDRLAPTLENAIYRIAQEALTNACQHSKSEKVRVSLLQQEDRVRIEIRDWGVGFDAKTRRGDRFGLEGIRQRTRLLGGKCSIRSAAGKGTRIAVELPVVVRE